MGHRGFALLVHSLRRDILETVAEGAVARVERAHVALSPGEPLLQILGDAAVLGDLIRGGPVKVQRERLRRLVQLRRPEDVIGVGVRREHLRASLQVSHLQHVLLEPIRKLR